MATAAYINGRKRFTRPQAILWSENAGTLIDGLYVPTGQEIGASSTLTAGGTNQFLVLSDHNRSELNFSPQRIERRMRTVNGRMRSYHIADKNTLSVSWSNLPSRGFAQVADFNASGKSALDGKFGLATANDSAYTVDGGAGGVELLDWYETHKGPFWMFLAYDKYKNFGTDNNAFGHLNQYNQIIQVQFSDFQYSVVKRGQGTHDLWDVSVTLEEV